MKPWYAINARKLLDDRQNGIVPADAVSVVLTTDNHPATALYVKPDMPLERMDWRMLVNLDVWLWASPAVPLERWMRVARDIAAVRPKRLTLRFSIGAELHDVDVGHGLHTHAIADIPAVHEFTWTPNELTYTPAAYRLRRALTKALPKWSAL